MEVKRNRSNDKEGNLAEKGIINRNTSLRVFIILPTKVRSRQEGRALKKRLPLNPLETPCNHHPTPPPLRPPRGSSSPGYSFASPKTLALRERAIPETLTPPSPSHRRRHMASRGAYDGGSGAGGKIRRRPPSRAAAASPYARPAPASAATRLGGGGGGGGWFSRLVASGASLLLPSVFRKPPPPQPEHEREREHLGEPPSLPELLEEAPSQAETLDTPPSPPPPPLGLFDRVRR